MKRIFTLLLAMICILSLLGCNKNKIYFDSTVTEKSGDLYTVLVTDMGTSGISISSQVHILEKQLPADSNDFEVGDSIRIFFDGMPQECSPLRLNEVYKAELLKETAE